MLLLSKTKKNIPKGLRSFGAKPNSSLPPIAKQICSWKKEQSMNPLRNERDLLAIVTGLQMLDQALPSARGGITFSKLT